MTVIAGYEVTYDLFRLEERRQKSEDRSQKTEVRRQKGSGGGQVGTEISLSSFNVSFTFIIFS